MSVTMFDARLARITNKRRQIDAFDPHWLAAVETLADLAIREHRNPENPRALDTRLRRVHPGCGDGGFHQLPSHHGRRSWRCIACGAVVTLPEGGM